MQWEYLFVYARQDGKDDATQIAVSSSDKRYEQKRRSGSIFALVNQLGAEGWELVNCRSPQGIYPWTRFDGVFKRPKAED